jgi:hypothetical protein
MLTAQVPPTAITGPVAVQTGGQMSAPLILEVVADATSLKPPASVIVDTGAVTSGIDIYVPPPAAGLNLTQIGVGNSVTSVTLGSSSVEIARGQTRQLVLAGTGMSAAAGTSVSISGGGVTVGSPVFQGSFLFVDVTAAAGAEPGARNVVVTNSNLDQSVFSGGLFIR